ncbi:MtrB/PioB family decaheme-associated outer membrane protein [Halorhodospira halophila]|uniref:MtrB/PioB family decaheme-associated outer membrane protein n=1 Tax=Halorhodospira halophila (strain DSM 244 / SL1) TaxID=349124 RepID=A1WZN1_HALHL|nr:MtrB/PioB family decaheme-associated outer membrane protein [Halorhodospira halophila]ABM63143.1 hypothetical protein Hhal_2380 [Halorhodospira halophila SL1]MBK1729322.1 hypothetical protein [Halorhodospira halophila]
MTRTTTKLGSSLALSATALFIVAGADAGTPESSATFVGPTESEIWLGFGYLDQDNSHFRRYTGPVEDGLYPALELDLRYRGEDEQEGRYGRLEGRDLGLDSRRLRGRYGVQGSYGLHLQYDELPRSYDHDVVSPLRDEGGDLRLPQVTGDVETDSRDWEVGTQRERTAVGAHRVLGDNWKLDVGFSREEKEGHQYRGYGIWSDAAPRGFQMPAPVDQRTDQLDLGAEYAGDALQARVGYHLSEFTQLSGDSFDVDDPRADDWTNLEEGDRHRLSRPPENRYHQFSGSMAYALQPGTSVSGSLVYGRAEQDESFIDDSAYEDVLDVLGNNLDGRIDTTRLGLQGTHRFHPRVRVKAEYEYEDRDNQSAQWDDLPTMNRSTRVHDWTRHRAGFDADFRLPMRSNLMVGYQYEEKDRTYADDETIEDTYRGRLRSQPTDNLSITVRGAYMDRWGASYAGGGSALADNIPELDLYHMADLTRLDIGASATYHLIPELALGAEFTYLEDDYVHSDAGLEGDDRSAVTLSADYFPVETTSGYAFLTYEERDRAQGGDDRSLTQEEEILTLGVGGETSLDNDQRWTLGTELLYATSDSDILVADPDGDQRYPTLETRLTQLQLYGEHQITDSGWVRLAYVGQRFEEQDWMKGFGPDPDPDDDGEFVLMGREAYDYTAHLVVGSVGFKF